MQIEKPYPKTNTIKNASEVEYSVYIVRWIGMNAFTSLLLKYTIMKCRIEK